MLLQVHDELLFELPESELPAVNRPVCEIMGTAYPMAWRTKVETKHG